MKFKIGDKARTEFGNGEIVFITDDFFPPIQYLVKIEGLEGHSGKSGWGYVNEDGLNDKWWFLEHQLELLKKEEV